MREFTFTAFEFTESFVELIFDETKGETSLVAVISSSSQ